MTAPRHAAPVGRHPRPDHHPPKEWAAPMSTLTIDHVSRWFGNVVAVNDITMTIGPGVTGLLGPNGGRQVHPHQHDGRLSRALQRLRHPRRDDDLAQRRHLPPHRHRPGARGDVRLPHGARIRRRQRGAARPRPGGGGQGAGHRRDGVRPGPQDLDVQQGHATAREDGFRAGPRPVRAAARRAVQRYGPAAADAADGAAAADGRRGPYGPVLLAHPRRGRATRLAHRGGGGRTPCRVRRLPQDPCG